MSDCYIRPMSPDPRDLPFDRALRRIRRDRALRSADDAGFLHRRATEELLDRLGLVTRRFDRALVVGCADLSLVERLQAQAIQVVAADPGARFARAAGGIQCDEDFLPFADGSFDLVVALATLDSVNDLPGALSLIRRILRPDGLFLAAFVGAGSLPRLRRSLRAAEEAQNAPASPRLHPQIDLKAAGDLLMRAGFALPVVDGEAVTVRYNSWDRLVSDLRAMAGTNLLSSRARPPFGRLGYAASKADFESDTDEDGKTAERFEILYLSGWAPSPDQPRPARRGSATHSLAEALRKPDQV
jgi:SAM-dependent methyltransferase